MTERDFVNRGSAGTNRQPNLSPGMTPSGSATEPISEQLGQAVSNVKEQAGEKVEQLTDQARQTVTAQVATQKQKASEALSAVAHALRETSTQMRSTDQAAIGEYTTKAADQVERLSGFLRDRDVSDILHEAEQFARRQPAAFLGGAFVLGLLGARFLKSSRPATQGYSPQDYNRPPYNRDRYPSAPVYQQNRPLTGGTDGPNYNPANVQQPRSSMNSGGQFNPSDQRGMNPASATNLRSGTRQSAGLGSQPFGSAGDQEDR